MAIIETREFKITKLLFSDTRLAWFWFLVRLYIGYEWIMAGWQKLGSSVWTGDSAGMAVKGFLQGALQKADGAHPDVLQWYAYCIKAVALPNCTTISYVVTYGEILVGICMILGLFTGVVALLGITMNTNYLFAGSAGLNPVMLLLQIGLVLAWRISGWWGLDKYVLVRMKIFRPQKIAS